MLKSENRRETFDRLHARILATAAEMLAEGGLKALTARKLGTRIGATTRVVYSHFGGMEQLIVAVYTQAFEQLRTSLNEQDASDTLPSALARFAHAYRRFALASPILFELMYGARAVQLIPTEADRVPAEPSLQLLIDLLTRFGCADHRARTNAYQFWTAIHGPVVLEVTRWIEGHDHLDAVLRAVVPLIVEDVAKSSS